MLVTSLYVAVAGIQFGIDKENSLNNFPVGFLAVSKNNKIIKTRRYFALHTLHTHNSDENKL